MGLQIKRDQLRNLVTKWVGDSNENEETDEYVNHSTGLGIGAKPAKAQKGVISVFICIYDRSLRNSNS